VNKQLKNLTKALLARHLEDFIGLEPEIALMMVETFFEEIILALEKGEKVQLANLGQFLVKQKKSRPGRNPKTKEEIPISARNVVVFHASPTLRKILNQLSLETSGV
jgi:integration host factor subunit alpha